MITKSQSISEALLELKSDPRASNHPLERYAKALEGSDIRVLQVVTSGGDSLVFEQPNGQILKLTPRLMREPLGSRPFDIPVIEKGTVDTGDGLTIQYFVQPKAQTPVTNAQLRLFKAELRRLGYILTDSGERQLGVFNSSVRLLDPFAAIKL